MARGIYRVLGVEHVRHRRPAALEVVLRRLLSLDYLLERPRTPGLPTGAEKVAALTAAGTARDVLTRRLCVTALPRADPEAAGSLDWVELVVDLP